MTTVRIDVDYLSLEGDYGDVEGIEVTCLRCGHSVQVFGTGEPSKLRAAAQLRDECPRNELNFYRD